ncbi:hypothetical protein [Hymenobacter arizonensis]|uniref:hypothetical protein n=1 Tax=Hymenobacter arizonensis TaxID=1227077 RepID=UPI000B851830|nr:hypothetical protein [Hymenobacter arizonensis]
MFKATHSPRLTGLLRPFCGDTRVVRWRDRTFLPLSRCVCGLHAQGQATRLKLNLISNLRNFSYDFQDFNLQQVMENTVPK